MPIQFGPAPIIQTRRCTSIPVERGEYITTEEIESSIRVIDGKYSDRDRRKDRKEPNGQYNCHGLTFLNRRAFMHPSSIKIVLEDDMYYRIDELAAVKPGDIVLYYADKWKVEIEHSGIVTRNEYRPSEGFVLPNRVIWVLSKWGYGPETEHPVDYGPYITASSMVEYMREGKDDVVTNYRRN